MHVKGNGNNEKKNYIKIHVRRKKNSVFYKCLTLQNILKHGYFIIEYNMLRCKELFDLRQYDRDKYKMTSR